MNTEDLLTPGEIEALPVIAFAIQQTDRLDFPFYRENRLLRIRCEYPDEPEVIHDIWSDESIFWPKKGSSEKELVRIEVVGLTEQVVGLDNNLHQEYGWEPNPKDSRLKPAVLTLITLKYRKTRWEKMEDVPKKDESGEVKEFTWLHSFASRADVPRPPVMLLIY